MSDRILNCPEVIFEKIYRKCTLPTQRNLYRAYRDEEIAPGLDRVMAHKMSTSCWCCMAEIFYTMFGDSGGIKDPNIRQGRSMYFAEEPSLVSPGFPILFKFAKQYENKKIFIQRDLKSLADMKDADQVFYDFQDKLQNVFKARNIQSLKDHLDSEHRRTKYMPRNFFRQIKFEIGN